jgi:hypothetical protein
MRAYEEAIRATASHHAPWFVVPADERWFTRLVVAAAIVEAVEQLDLTYPKVDARKKEELATMRSVGEVLRVLDAPRSGQVSPCGWHSGEPTLAVA